MGRFLSITSTWAKRCAVALIGGTVVFIGILMIVLPGPAFIVIPAGLAILSIEFAWARRWLHRVRTSGTQMLGRTRSWLQPNHEQHDERRKHDDRRVRASTYYRQRPIPAQPVTAQHHSSMHRADTKRDSGRV